MIPAVRQPSPLPQAPADAYARPALVPGPPLVLVHGLTGEGKDDARAVRAAELLAAAGFRVLAPTIAGLTRGRLRPDDVEPVVQAITAMHDRHGRPVAVIGVSIGAGPALLAAADPRVRERVGVVMSLGGYASAPELVRFFLTGTYAFGDARGHTRHDPALVREFVAANADLIDGATAEAFARGDAAAAGEALQRLPPETRAMLAALSPERVARDIRARLVLIHARADPAVPYTESLRLAAARPERTTVIVVDILGHVEGRTAGAWRTASDLVRIWASVYGVLAG
jgi:pimeloyl-ACP methyl ester carboxylesterase